MLYNNFHSCRHIRPQNQLDKWRKPINFLSIVVSTFYQRFINFLSTVYQLINFYQLLSTLSTFYQLLNKLLNQFLCCQTWSHATYCQMIVAACLLFCGLAGECVEQLHGSAMDAFEWWLKPSWFKPWFCLACEEFRCSGVQVFIVTCHV